MARGDLDHTEEMLYKQSKERLTGGETFGDTQGVVHHRSSWKHDDLYTGEHKSASSFSFKVFIASALLVVFAGAFLFYTLTVNPATVDSRKILINIEAPPFVQGGQEEKAIVAVSNTNQVNLNEAKLIFTYDKGGTLTGEPDRVIVTKDIGVVASQAVIKQEFPFLLFGSQNEKKLLGVRLEYKIPGQNALFPKEASSEITVSAPPLTVTVEGAESVISGEQTDYTLVIKNTTETVSNQAIAVLTPPTGFSLIKVSDPQIEKLFAWEIPKLMAGEEKRISLRGVFTGVVGEKATLKVAVGSKKDESSASIAELFSSDAKVLEYTRPGLTGNLLLETDRGASTILRKGDKVSVSIQYRNDGLSKIAYAEYTLRLPETIDPRQVFVSQSGYYDIGTHSIIWSSDAYERLLSLGAGQGGSLGFSFVLPSDYKDSSLPLFLLAKGVDATVGKPVETRKDFSYVVSGSTAFTAYTVFSDTLRPNTGPIPPRVNQETTYTAILTVSSQTDVKDAKASFTFPSLYVKYIDGMSASSTVSYDSRTKLVTWNIGSLTKDMTATASIKLAVKPSLVHVGSAPGISSKILFSAEDIVTKEKLQQVGDPLTTAIVDSGNDYTAGIVIK